ncbi:MAG: universal stress protein [Chitinophagaceae bacterium]
MKTILVPSDYSKNADTALLYAIKLGNLLQTNLVVFHCYQVSFNVIAEARSEEQTDLLIKKDIALHVEKLQSHVKSAYKELGINTVPSTTIVGAELNPLVVEKTIEVARQHHADLIVMGTHGASGLNKLFFGSNTSTMISKSGIPVLAIPENYSFKNIETIALASDLEDPEDELKRVMPFVTALDARLDIVHLDYGLDAFGRKEQQAVKFIEKCDYKKIRLVKQKAVLEHTLLKQLRKYLDEHKPEWIIMFTKERSFWDKILLRSKTEDMANFLELPLLSFRKRQQENS